MISPKPQNQIKAIGTDQVRVSNPAASCETENQNNTGNRIDFIELSARGLQKRDPTLKKAIFLFTG